MKAVTLDALLQLKLGQVLIKCTRIPSTEYFDKKFTSLCIASTST